MLAIRMSRKGSKKHPFYKIIVIDSRYSGEGKSIDKVGFFNPLAKYKENKQECYINNEKIKYWISKGAQLSKRVKSLIKNYYINIVTNNR